MRHQQRRVRRLGRVASRVDRRSRLVAAFRLGAALGAVALLVASGRLSEHAAGLQAGAAAFALVFAAGVVVHRRVHRRLRLLRSMVRVSEREVDRLQGDWKLFDEDGAGLEEHRSLAEDLGITGRWSLFQAVSRCATPFGARSLAGALTRGVASPDLAQRQDAVRELARREAFRHRLEAEGSRGSASGATPEDFERLLGRSSIHDGRPWLLHLARGLVPLTAILGVLKFGLSVSTASWPFWICLAAQVALVSWSHGRAVSEYDDLLTLEESILAWSDVLALLEQRRFRSSLLRVLRDRLRGGELHGATAPSSECLRRLGDILASLALRHGGLHPVANVLVLWDLHQLGRLSRWRREVGSTVFDWFEVLGEIEALSSLGAHAASLAQPTFPTFRADGPVLEARGAWHPLLPAGTAVPNDVSLSSPGTLLLVTGSNMSGKSTLLRTLGLNVTLALAGGAVHARSLALRPVRLMTSIHLTDALDAGVSLFHAEVRRVKQMLDAVALADDESDQPPVLYLVDEILRGTNTRERLIASRAIIRRLAGSRSAGLVTSHDLSLVVLEDELVGVFNVHFRETIEDGRMSFDYGLRPGPVTTTNALAVLRLEGVDLDFDENG